MLKAFITLIGCIAFLGAVLWWVKRKTSRGHTGTQDIRIRVVARQPLSSKASVAVVEVGDTTLVLGVTEHSVTNLGTGTERPSPSTLEARRPSGTIPPTFGPPPTYPPIAPPSPFPGAGAFPPATVGSAAPDVSIGGYLKTLFRKG
ncbi:MAG: flagellar biosynthetic protein FliO [Candidatus Kapaibacterium sp.]